MTANYEVRAEFKVKVFTNNGTTIETVVGTLNEIVSRYNGKLNNGSILNYQVYFNLRGNYQLVAEGVEEYGM